MTDIPREERTSIIPIPCHWSMGNATSRLKTARDIYYADLTPVVGCEQGGRRPVLVIQNDVGNHHGSTVIVAAITSRRRRKRRLPTHIGLPRLPTGLRTASFAMLEQVRTIDRMRLGAYIGRLDGERMAAVDRAILISFGLDGLVGYDGKNAEK